MSSLTYIVLLDPLGIFRTILSKPVERFLHESVKVVDGIAEELDGRHMLGVSKAAVAVDSTLGGGLATLHTQPLVGGGALQAASFVLTTIPGGGLATLDTQLLGGGGTLTAASFVLPTILGGGLATLDTQLLLRRYDLRLGKQ